MLAEHGDYCDPADAVLGDLVPLPHKDADGGPNKNGGKGDSGVLDLPSPNLPSKPKRPKQKKGRKSASSPVEVFDNFCSELPTDWRPLAASSPTLSSPLSEKLNLDSGFENQLCLDFHKVRSLSHCCYAFADKVQCSFTCFASGHLSAEK